jgi:hypothetical protein
VKRALLSLFLVASPAFAQANGWAEMANGWGEIQTVPGFTTIPPPASATLGCVGVFLGSPLALGCTDMVYTVANKSLDVTYGRVQAGNLRAIPLPASGAVTVEPKLSPLGGITVVGPAVRATGLLTVPAAALLSDTETFSIHDGSSQQGFEFDTNSAVVNVGFLPVDLTGLTTAEDVAAACASAINGATGVGWTVEAIDNLDGTVTLRNTAFGAAGNAANAEAVGDAGFILTNMTGGADGIIDGDALSVGDGTGIVPIEFDAAPGDGTTGGAVPIVFDGTETATQIRDAVKAILDGAGRDWTTSAQGADGIGLVRATPGATGGAITEDVTDAGFSVNDWTAPTAATTYTYSLQACLADGTCNAAGAASSTAAGVLTLSAYNLNRLSWSAVAGAASYKIRRDVGGATQGVIWSGTALTVDDTGLAGDGSAKPTVDGTGTLTGRGVLARGSTVAMGGGGATATIGGTLYVTTTPATTTGTTEEVLATYTMPADTLATNGRGVRITASYTHAANTNSTIAYVKFGGQQVAVRSNVASGATTRITVEVIRTGPATQWYTALATGSTNVQALSGALTVDLSGGVNITATATTGTIAGDLTLDFFLVEAI